VTPQNHSVKLPSGTQLGKGATIQAPAGYVPVANAGAIKFDGFTLPEQRAQRRQYPVSKLKGKAKHGTTRSTKRQQYAIALDRPAYGRASKRSVARSK
jgi:hypothetical protein